MRKLIQLTTAITPENDVALIGLADDGTVWVYTGSVFWASPEAIPDNYWKQFPSIPQDKPTPR